ncbi:M48 family metalloprotease [Cryobacterium sp. PH31-AA6]|uniref:M56 family metallopeptidase n=1 Tax=Cryobacterium sp. PH31-AA6 TaxID=3046205 RepID=UPI0024BBD30F|nr:M56 family metallopeptidase [Cryobacterium sp. PH31-AA6]MDJ0325181.1 M48 family metalloprotease [Cryobacterium sp. PH31-AA6]
MTIALILASYALVLSLAVPPLLRHAAWADRAPRLGIATWQALTVAVVGSLALAGSAWAFPVAGLKGKGMGELLAACAMALRQQYSTPIGAAVGFGGALLAVIVVTRCLWFLAATGTRMARERNAHRRVLDMIGRPDPERGIVILDSARPAVYCMPGLHRRTVVTTAALHALNEDELTAVLAHERAHLTERHDLALAFSMALAAAFAGLPPFRIAADETARLVELRADDVASARTHRLTVAAALLSVVSAAPHTVPAAALGAGGAGAGARVRRLLPPRRPVGRFPVAVLSLGLALVLAAPALVLGVTAATTDDHALCPTIPVAVSASLGAQARVPTNPQNHVACAVDSMDEPRITS